MTTDMFHLSQTLKWPIRGHLSVYDKWYISVVIWVFTTSGTYPWSFECLRQVEHIHGHSSVYDKWNITVVIRKWPRICSTCRKHSNDNGYVPLVVNTQMTTDMSVVIWVFTTSGTYPWSFECLRQVVHIRGHQSVYDKWYISVVIWVFTQMTTDMFHLS
jgi:hypothetical protein